jgi:hypothetical protein
VRLVKGAALLLLLSLLVAGCAAAGSPGFLGGFSAPFAEADARVRGDLGIPDDAPSPRIIYEFSGDTVLARGLLEGSWARP